MYEDARCYKSKDYKIKEEFPVKAHYKVPCCYTSCPPCRGNTSAGLLRSSRISYISFNIKCTDSNPWLSRSHSNMLRSISFIGLLNFPFSSSSKTEQVFFFFGIRFCSLLSIVRSISFYSLALNVQHTNNIR